MRERHVNLLWFGGVVLVAAAVRLWALGSRAVWFDEAVSLLIARSNWRGVFRAAWDDTHPPLYNMVLMLWNGWLPGEWNARLLSVLAGTLTVGAVFGLGYRLGGRKAAGFAGLFLALNPLHVWFSQEIRMYALLALFVSLSWLLLLWTLEGKGTGHWLLYTLATAASLQTHYAAVFSLAGQWLYVLSGWRPHRGSLRQWGRSQFGVLILFAPWLPVFWHHLSAKTFGYWMQPFQWEHVLWFFGLLSGAIQHNPGPYWPWVAVTVVVLGVAWWQRRSVALIAWLLVPVALLAVLSLRSNVFLPRSLVFVAPAFAVTVGWALADAPRRLGLACGLLLAGANLFGLAMYFTEPNPWVRSDLRAAAWQVADEFRQGDLVIHTSRFSYRPFQYYVGDEITQGLEQETEAMPKLFEVIGDSRPLADWTPYRRVWVVRYADFQRSQAGEQVRDWLRSGFDAGRELYRGDRFHITRYERR